jgi:hypothetical protein
MDNTELRNELDLAIGKYLAERDTVRVPDSRYLTTPSPFALHVKECGVGAVDTVNQEAIVTQPDDDYYGTSNYGTIMLSAQVACKCGEFRNKYMRQEVNLLHVI